MTSDSTCIWNKSGRGGLAGFICLLCLLTSAYAGPIQLGSTNVNTGVSFSIPLTVDSGNQVLGDYTADFSFNTNVLRVAGITGGTGVFAATPTFNTNTPGRIVLAGMNTSSLTSPTGVTLVAQFSFTAIGSPGANSSLAFNSASADDMDGAPLSTTTVNGLVSINWFPPGGFTASLAFDKASDPAYSGGWTNGSNGGVGWGTNSWQLFVADVQTNNLAANFISSSTNNNANGHTNVVGDIDTAGVAWGILGAGPAGTQGVGALRFFNGSLTNGQRFVVYMDNGFVPADQFVGFFLLNNTPNLDTRLQFLATNQTYVLQGDGTGIAPIPTGIANTDEGLKIEVQVVNVDTVNVFVTKLVTGTQSVFSNITLGIVNGGRTHEIQGFAFINTGAGRGATNQVFFNSIAILPNPTDTTLFADLAVATTASPNPAIAGSNLTYTVTVTNKGPAQAIAVTLTDVPPAGIAFVTTPSQGTCTNIAGQIIYDLGILTNNGIAYITLVGTPPSAGTITNTAVVTALNVDPNPTNNVVTNIVNVVVNNLPMLVVTPASRNFGTLMVGDSSTQSFSVINVGNGTLSGTSTVSGTSFALLSGSPFNVSGGQTSTVSVTFSPASAGSFTGSVVFASNGGVSTNAVTGAATNVFAAPIAGFIGTPTSGAAPLLVSFTDASSGTITGRVWSFGDGSTSTAPNPSHTYTNTGVFSVSLTILGPGGSNTLTRPNYITVTNVLPVAAFAASPTSGAAPLLVSFTDASSGTITGRVWSFGDGDTSTATSPSHVYTNAGTFSISLTVFGPLGSASLTRPNYITALTPFQSWQLQYFGCIDCPQAATTADSDGDGQNNINEFLAGTDPTSSASAFRIIEIAPDDDDMLIAWTAVGGKRYVLQTTTGHNGSFSNDFVDLNPAIVVLGTGETEVAVLHLGGATNAPARYYRVRLVP